MDEHKKVPLHLPLSPLFIGEVGEEVLFMPPVGFAFKEMPLGATNGLLMGFAFTKMSLMATKAHQTLFCNP
jgi:hypothetical protein